VHALARAYHKDPIGRDRSFSVTGTRFWPLAPLGGKIAGDESVLGEYLGKAEAALSELNGRERVICPEGGMRMALISCGSTTRKRSNGAAGHAWSQPSAFDRSFPARHRIATKRSGYRP